MFKIIDSDTNKRGEEIMEDRPCGIDSEYRQVAKTINTDGQKRLWAEKRRRELAKKYNKGTVERNVIKNILKQNKAVELELGTKTESNLLENNSLQHFLPLITNKLKDFVHARKFTSKSFLTAKLTPTGKKLNKTVYRTQTVEEIEQDYNNENPCP